MYEEFHSWTLPDSVHGLLRIFVDLRQVHYWTFPYMELCNSISDINVNSRTSLLVGPVSRISDLYKINLGKMVDFLSKILFLFDCQVI